MINNVGDHNGGTYTVVADNSIGAPQSTEVKVIIFPILPSIEINVEKNIFKPGSDASLECKVTGRHCG